MKLVNQLKSLTAALGTLALFSSAISCGDSDEALSSLYGIYELSAWNENDVSCGDDGPSVLADKIEKYLVVKEGEFFVKFVSAEACENLEACRAVAVDDTLNLSAYLFNEGNDSDGWTGERASAFGSGDSCSGDFTQFTMTSPESGVVEIVTQNHSVEDVGRDADDFCDLDEVETRGPTEPCTARQLMRATLVEKL